MPKKTHSSDGPSAKGTGAHSPIPTEPRHCCAACPSVSDRKLIAKKSPLSQKHVQNFHLPAINIEDVVFPALLSTVYCSTFSQRRTFWDENGHNANFAPWQNGQPQVKKIVKRRSDSDNDGPGAIKNRVIVTVP